MFDLSAKRELNNGFGNALSTAVELAVTPTVMGLAGWQVDRWLGTFPVVFIFLFLFTVSYVCWKQFTGYSATMDRKQHELLGPKRDRGTT